MPVMQAEGRKKILVLLQLCEEKEKKSEIFFA